MSRARLLAVAVLSTLALGAPAGALASYAHPTLPEIEVQAMCVTCKIPLNTAKSPQANAEREFIREQISAGDNEAGVKKALVAQYGPAVLTLPEAKGFGLAAYIVPVAVVLVLLAGLAMLLPRWLRSSPSGPATTPGARLSASDAERLERDMKRFD